MRRFPLGPLASVVVLAVVILAGGLYNTVEAKGRVVHDWTGEPLEATVSYGSRSATTGADGAFDLGLVPRDAELVARKQGFEAQRFPPDRREVRLAPGGVTIRVQDPAGRAVNGVEARQGDNVIGRSPGNILVVTPHPGRDVPFTVCAKDFGPQEVRTSATSLELTLTKGPGCPPAPSPSPAPAPTPSPGASPTPSSTGSP